MALKIDIDLTPPAEVDSGVFEIIENVCGRCTLGYKEDLYAGVHLTGNDGIREINREFRSKDEATDVLSFPILENEEGRLIYDEFDRDMETGCIILGDIIISTEKTHVQAQEYGHSFEREIAFLTCHGMLHLLGYDHENKEDEARMIEKQKHILNELGYVK